MPRRRQRAQGVVPNRTAAGITAGTDRAIQLRRVASRPLPPRRRREHLLRWPRPYDPTDSVRCHGCQAGRPECHATRTRAWSGRSGSDRPVGCRDLAQNARTFGTSAERSGRPDNERPLPGTIPNFSNGRHELGSCRDTSGSLSLLLVPYPSVAAGLLPATGRHARMIAGPFTSCLKHRMPRPQ